MEIKNKRGWIRILEATIAVMIISGALLVVYSKQVDREDSREDYYYSLQKQILSDISLQSDLRLHVLNIVDEDLSDSNFSVIDDFVSDLIPDTVGYSISVCKLEDSGDHCAMNSTIYLATIDKDIYVKDVIISSALDNEGNSVYDPTKIRLFFWDER